MDPIDRANSQIIENLEKIIVEQNQLLDKAKQEISILQRQIEVNDEYSQFRINKVIEEFHIAIDKMVTPSLN
jgi:hypothetical protein